MNDKEYTYDIDKYTIGVDTNGEDGIGMSVAIIKNGEINFLGNCYGENARCIDLLIKENQALKKHLKVPKACNLKTLEDYKSYYEDTTREQILEDTYIEYCAYVNLAHRYSKLKKQVEEYKEQVNKGLYNTCLPYTTGYNKAIKDKETQQKEFIKYLEKRYKDVTSVIGSYGSNTDMLYGKKDMLEEILQKYKEIIGENDV